MRNSGGLWIMGIIGAIILVVVLYFHSKHMADCDAKGGILVKSGFGNACVKQF